MPSNETPETPLGSVAGPARLTGAGIAAKPAPINGRESKEWKIVVKRIRTERLRWSGDGVGIPTGLRYPKSWKSRTMLDPIQLDTI